jgi:hypothetical protein
MFLQIKRGEPGSRDSGWGREGSPGYNVLKETIGLSITQHAPVTVHDLGVHDARQHEVHKLGQALRPKYFAV